jgi:hypothetical protein
MQQPSAASLVGACLLAAEEEDTDEEEETCSSWCSEACALNLRGPSTSSASASVRLRYAHGRNPPDAADTVAAVRGEEASITQARWHHNSYQTISTLIKPCRAPRRLALQAFHLSSSAAVGPSSLSTYGLGSTGVQRTCTSVS